MYPTLWRGFPWFNIHKDRQGAYYSSCSVFVAHPTECASVAQGLFYWWVRAQGQSPYAPGIDKNTFGPVGISPLRVPQAPGNKPNSPEGSKAWWDGPWGWRKYPVAETHSARSVLLQALPAEVPPNNWRNTVLIQPLLSLYRLSSWLIYPLSKSIILVIGESPTIIIIIINKNKRKLAV